jgi:glycosyltransferase involved in cell wall biosynthesis
MNVLFLLHEQHAEYTSEPAYTEVVRPFICSGFVTDSRDVVYQRMLRENRDNYLNHRLEYLRSIILDRPLVVYGAGELTRKLFETLRDQFNVTALSDSNEKLWHKQFNSIPVIPPEDISHYSEDVLVSAYASEGEIVRSLHERYGSTIRIHMLLNEAESEEAIHSGMETAILAHIDDFRPDLIVHTLTFAGENLRGSFLKFIHEHYPQIKMYTQWWDYAENIPRFLEFEKDCLRYSDMVGIIDSYSRYTKIRHRTGIYGDYPCVEKLHWHPTVFDPDIYRKTFESKHFDVCIMGSAEGRRKGFIDFLSKEYGEKFHHFGGRGVHEAFVSKDDYVSLLNRTRIFVNTQTSEQRVQFKGKVREALSCGIFILEEDNPETRSFVKDGVGIRYFKDAADLKAKIDYYLEHDDEREEIAMKGYQWYHGNHDARSWVSYILHALNMDNGEWNT